MQLIYIFYFSLPFQIDSLAYFNLAQECLAQNRLYPLPQHVNADYLVAPVYLNFIIVILKIYNSPNSDLFSSMLFLNFLQLFLVYRIGLRLFNARLAQLAILLYVFYLPNLGLVLQNLTELLFGVLALLSFLFYLKGKKNYCISRWIFFGFGNRCTTIWLGSSARLYFILFSATLFQKT